MKSPTQPLPEDPAPLVVLTTFPSDETAKAAAGALVREKHAACVSLLPGIFSVYFWDGNLQQDEECLLLIKTRADAFSALRDRLAALHPYDTPEILALRSADVSAAYAQWVAQAVSPPTETSPEHAPAPSPPEGD